MAEFRILNEQLGVQTHSNPVTSPKGTLTAGDNWEAVRDNVYRKPRGREVFGSGLPSANILQFLEYKNRLFVHMSDYSLWYDSDGAGTFAQVTGTFKGPDAASLIKDLEQNGNLYLCTETGLKKLDELGGTAVDAGLPQGLDSDLRLVTGTILEGSGTGVVGHSVAYRHLWTVYDANNNKIFGAPSDRAQIDNTTGSAKAVSYRLTIPNEITASHTLEVYRTSITTGSSTDLVVPPEDFQLVYQAKPSSAEISAGYMVVTDTLPEGFRGAELYTNTTQEGIANSNTRPPKAASITKYKNFTFFGNIESLQRLYFNLVSIANLTAGVSTLTVTDGTHTLALGCVADVADRTISSVANASGLCEITTSVAHGYSNGDYVRFLDVTGVNFPGAVNEKVFEVTVTAADKFKINLAWNASYTATAGTVDFYEDIGSSPRFIISGSATVSVAIDATARSIIRTVNQAVNNAWWYGYYISGYDDIVGKMVLTADEVGTDEFWCTANNSAFGDSFTPAMPFDSNDHTYKSINDQFSNGLQWSKAGEPEHVPLVNIDRVGSADDPILAVVGLRDSLFIIKKKDGVYRLTGENAQGFSIDEFDGTVECIQKNSIAKGQNAIFMMSALGYSKISDVGVEVIGRANEFKDLIPRFSTNYATDGYGWFYEQEKSYFIATHEATTSTSNDLVKVYNTFSSAWMSRRHGVYTNDPYVKLGRVIDGLMYTAAITGNQVFQERKTYTADDFAAPSITNSITAIDTVLKRITLGTNVSIPEDSVIRQGSAELRVTDVISSSVVELSTVNNLTTAAITIVPGIVSELVYQTVFCDLPDYEKQFTKLVVFFDDDETSISRFEMATSTDLVREETLTQIFEGEYGYGLTKWGKVWGTPTALDRMATYIPEEHSRGAYIKIGFIHRKPFEQCSVCGFSLLFDAVDTRLET
jgi:hypothetical protein